ncbi:hypothetical protein Tco_0901236 [Tanacetum coccineum]
MADLPVFPDHVSVSPGHAPALPNHLLRSPGPEPAFPDHVVDFLDDDLEVEIEEDPEEDLGMDIDEEDPKEDQGMDFEDDDEVEEWKDEEDWLIAPVTPPRATTLYSTYEVGGPSSAAPEAPHQVGRPFSVVAPRDVLHHQELAALHVRLEGIESIQTELRRSKRAIVVDVGWLGERDGIIQRRTLSLVRMTLVEDEEYVQDVLDVVDIEIVELRDKVDDYPREQVDTLRVEVDGLHGSTVTLSQRVQTLETALQEARAEIQDLQTRLSASESSKRTMLPKRMNRNAIERLIADRVAAAIAEYEANWVNAAGGAGPTEAGGAECAGPAGNVAGGNVAPEVRGCSYKNFLNCIPHDFSGTKGVVGLSRWFEKLESVFGISKCVDEDKVKFAACTLQIRVLMWWNSDVLSLSVPDRVEFRGKYGVEH